MPSAWISPYPPKKTGRKTVSYRVFFRVGGRESVPQRAGSFKTKRDAERRRAWVIGEMAAMRVPDIRLTALEGVSHSFRGR